ncbi:MAG: hypothetical protein ABIP03_04085 [Aquihabitans sp.]
MSFGGGEAPPPPPPAPSSGFDGAAQDDDGTWLSTMPPSTDASPATDKLWAAIGAAVVVLLVVVGAVVLLSGGKDSKSTLVAISIPTGPQAGDIPFGASGGKNPQFISDIGEFCDGYKYLHEFQVGFETKLTKAKSMSSFGAWYDANDGFGNAGLGRMEGSFRPTSRPPLERIRRYLAMLDDVARMNSVSQAKIQLISETAPYLDEIEAINEVAGQHC